MFPFIFGLLEPSFTKPLPVFQPDPLPWGEQTCGREFSLLVEASCCPWYPARAGGEGLGVDMWPEGQGSCGRAQGAQVASALALCIG